MRLLHYPLPTRPTFPLSLEGDVRIFFLHFFHINMFYGDRAYPTRSSCWSLSTRIRFKTRTSRIRGFAIIDSNEFPEA